MTRPGSRTERAVGRYRRLLGLFPEAYRTQAGDELCQVFREAYADARRTRGRLGVASLWLRVGLDVARTAPGEWKQARRKRRVMEGRTGKGRGDSMLKSLIDDLRYAVRGLAKSPGFTLVAVLILGLGIGANTTIFAVLDALYFDAPPHVQNPDRLVRLYRTRNDYHTGALPYPDYAHYRDNAVVFDGLIAYDESGIALTISRDQGRIDGRGTFVSDNYFDVLGTRPAAGRWFLPEEDRRAGTDRVAVLSYHVWHDLFGSDPGAIGQVVRLNGNDFTVVGVAPEGFRGPSPLETPPDVWFPIHAQPILAPTALPLPLERVPENNWYWLWAMGRLRDGVTLEAAQANVDAMADYLAQTYPEWNRGQGARLFPDVRFHPPAGSSVATMARLLLAVVTAVLLIASANIAILLLARGSARSRDVAVRIAIGAGRRRVVRSALTESLVLGLLGASVGVGVAYLAAGLVASLMPVSLSVAFAPDATVLAFAAGLAVVTALLFGVIPALQTARVDVNGTLKGEQPGDARSWLRSGLVVGQVAISMSLAVAASLLGRSLATASSVPLGYEVQDRMLLTLDLDNQGYDEEGGRAFVHRAVERLGAVPGVHSATPMVMVPFQGGWSTRAPAPGRQDGVEVGLNAVGPGFFHALGIRILAGRPIDARDVVDGTSAVVVSASMARLFWPDEDPVGQRILRDDGTTRFEVVGVAEDTRFNDLSAAPDAYAYMAYEQHYQSRVTFLIEGDVGIGPLREVILALDPGMAIVRLQSMRQAVNRELARFRTSALLVGVFGVLALGLAMVGLYGVLSYAVVQARRDIGIRVALGASTRRVGRGVVGRALRLTVLGLAAGALLTLAGTRLLTSFLYGVGARDPATWVVAAVGVLLVAGAASLLPAVRAARVDPMVALRTE